MSAIPYLDRKFKDEIGEAGFIELDDYMATIFEDSDWAGAINYVNYSMLKHRISENKGWKRYWRLALWIGTMVCCIFEAYRRIIGPYEDEAIQRNGDIE